MWTFGGYTGAGNVEPLINKSSGVAAICGNARGVFEELHEVLGKHEDVKIFGVNDVGIYLKKLDHWVSLHYEKMEVWKAARKQNGDAETAFKVHGLQVWGGVDYAWENLLPVHFSLSGYLAMQLAYLMGFERIILCGCPGDNTPRFFEYGNTRVNLWAYDAPAQVKELTDQMNRLPEFKAKVRSMSGATKEYFGGL